MYPLLEINIKKLEHNLDYVKNRLEEEGILLTGVLKGCACLPEVVEMYKNKGMHSLGSSRMRHLIEIKQSYPDVKTMLVRIPMLSEIDDVIRFANISLNSELATLKALCESANKYGVVHDVILMFDLGDLREGCFDESELLKLAEFVEKSKHLNLLGVGTNLSCYGSILPTEENMNRLVKVTEFLEHKINREIKFISGGSTSTFPLCDAGTLNPRINHLRIGEGMLNHKDLPFYRDIDYPMYDDAFILKAQIVEIKDKPSYPIGEMSMDAFGNKPDYQDRGVERRALCAVGNQDVGTFEKLVPVDKEVKLVGASSDHLIVSIREDSDYQVGSIMDFEIFYPAMLYLTNSRFVSKKYIYDIDNPKF